MAGLRDLGPRIGGLWMLWMMASVAVLGGAARLSGQFSAPVCLTESAEPVTQAATGIDLANNAYLASVIQERIQVKVFGPGVDAEVPLQAAGLGQGDPDFATDVRGTTYLVFSQLDDPTGALGREVNLTNNNGGQGFGEPVRVTDNRVDDASPRMALDEAGDPHLAWAQRLGERTNVLYVHTREGAPLEEPELAAVGDYPHLFVDRAGVVHLVYSRGNDLLYNNNARGRFDNERNVTTTPFDPESSASIGGDAEGNFIITYESRNALYYATRSGGASFRPPRLIDTGGILTPRMRVTGRGQVTVVYAKQGDIFYALGLPTLIGQPQRVTTTPEVESHPSLELDLSNNIHVSFISEGRLCYVNNAAVPLAEFSAEPTRGEVPLNVRFVDLSSGDIQLWRWDFGDGETSTAQHPTHRYSEPGKYTVSLTVESPGGFLVSKTRLDFITVQDPFNTLDIPDQLVIPGQKEVWFPVLAGHKEPIGAFQLMGTYDPNLLRLNRFDLAFTVVQPLAPEQLCLNDKGTYFEVCCIFDFFPPFDPTRQFLRAGTDQTIMNLVFDVADNAPQGARTEVDLLNDTSLSPVFNIFTIDNFTRLPALSGGQVEVLIGPPFPRFFLRGDADGDGAIDITDAIRILNFLFVGGGSPLCVDAADVTDSGRVDISQAISLLNYLFLGGPGPRVPFPTPGPDPTPDALPGC